MPDYNGSSSWSNSPSPPPSQDELYRQLFITWRRIIAQERAQQEVRFSNLTQDVGEVSNDGPVTRALKAGRRAA